jgi:hypothetical protein
VTSEVEGILDVVNETLGYSTKGIITSGCCSFVSLERVVRTTALSLPSSADTGLVGKRLPSVVMFCQWFLHQCGTNYNFPVFMIFTDGTQFTRDGIQNFQNQHLWAGENPHVILPSHTSSGSQSISWPIFVVIIY